MRRPVSVVLLALFLAPLMVLVTADPARAFGSAQGVAVNLPIFAEAGWLSAGTLPAVTTGATAAAPVAATTVSGTAASSGLVTAAGIGVAGIATTAGGIAAWKLTHDGGGALGSFPSPPAGSVYSPGYVSPAPGAGPLTFRVNGSVPAGRPCGGASAGFAGYACNGSSQPYVTLRWRHAGSAPGAWSIIFTGAWTFATDTNFLFSSVQTISDLSVLDTAQVEFVQDLAGGTGYSAPFASGFLKPQTADPMTVPRTIEQTVTCKRADGTTHQVGSVTGTTWAEVTEAYKAVAGLNCPANERAVDTKVEVRTPGATPEVVPLTPTITLPEWVADLPQACFAAGAVCHLDLTYPLNDLDPEAGRESCFNATFTAYKEPCFNWQQQPNPTETFQCRYGIGSTWVERPIAECYVYDFPPEGGDPSPHEDGPQTDCDFGWGDVLTGRIVLKAIKCGLTWAFVPRAAWLETQSGLWRSSWEASPPGVALGTLGAWFAPFGDLATGAGSDCLGPAITVEIPGAGTVLDNAHPTAVCDGLSAWAVGWFKPLIGAFAIWLTAATLLVIVARVFHPGAANPVQVIQEVRARGD
jgi:hypothetical protein